MICEAKTEAELKEERVKELEEELRKARIEARRAKAEVKLPPFFENIGEQVMLPYRDVGYAKQIVPCVIRNYQVWMFNELIKCEALRQISHKVVFSGAPVESIYNVAIERVECMKDHPPFPEKLIPIRGE